MSPQPTQSLQPDKKHSVTTEFQTLLCLIMGHSTVVHFIKYGFTHITSSLRYPHAKSEVECAVATVKGLWKGGGEKTTSFSHPYIKRFRSQKIEQMKNNMAVQSARPSTTLQSGQSIWFLREESQGAVICQAKTSSSYIIHTTERLVHTLTLPGTITDTLTWAEHPMRQVQASCICRKYIKIDANFFCNWTRIYM